MNELCKLSITEMHNGLKAKQFSAVELIEAHNQEIANEPYNSFVTKTAEMALESAKAADICISKGENLNPLLGIPIGVKDLFCTAGVRTTSCSRILDSFVPQYESTVTKLLKARGAVMVGKLNMDEFAMGSSNMFSYYGPAINPLKRNGDNKALVPGGSSGGSAAAVAGYLAAAALGSDTGGSVRQPAAFCGLVGLKPSYGRCSRFGMISFASSLDQAGILARSVADTALVLQAIAGPDINDRTTAHLPDTDFSVLLNSDLKAKKVGIPREYNDANISKEISAMWDNAAHMLSNAGAEVIDISLPHTSYALPVYCIISSAEASSNLERYDGVRYGLRIDADSVRDMYCQTRAAGFGREVKRRILTGTYILSANNYENYFIKAQKVRRLVVQDFDNAFENVDYILAPTAPSDAFALDEKPDTITMYLNDIFTVPASLAGLPAISVPAALSTRGMPLGMQIIGKRYDEAGILGVASIIERSYKR